METEHMENAAAKDSMGPPAFPAEGAIGQHVLPLAVAGQVWQCAESCRRSGVNYLPEQLHCTHSRLSPQSSIGFRFYGKGVTEGMCSYYSALPGEENHACCGHAFSERGNLSCQEFDVHVGQSEGCCYERLRHQCHACLRKYPGSLLCHVSSWCQRKRN